MTTKQILLFLVLFLFSYTLIAQAQNDHRTCASMHVLEQQLAANPNMAAIMEDIERLTEDHLPNGQRTVIAIPIVFHVVHNGDAVGSGENISDALILAQLQQMNDDFRKMNTDAGNVPAEFAGLHADTEIEFCLAVQDPNGNPTSGIERHDLGVSSWTSSTFNSTAKPATVWDRNSYLNFWIANLSGGLLGYAQFPGGPASTDGVVCLYSSVGSLDVPNPAGGDYDHGRTGTHEVGHWLNLRHIWGDSNNCNNDDLVGDTPDQNTEYYGCPSNTPATCSSNDMFMNYMDYVDDNCMIMFSTGQASRMDAILSPTNGARHSLLSSIGCVPLNPSVTFATAAFSTAEGTSSCMTAGTKDIILDVNITAAPTVTTVVEISISGTAGADDFSVSPTTLTFPAGSTLNETTTITVFEDAYVEGNEDVVLDLTILSGDLQLGLNPTHTLTVSNDDLAPGVIPSYDYLNDNFDSAPSGWTITDGGSTTDTWFYASNYGGNSTLNGTPFGFIDSDAAGNGSTSFEQLFSPVMNTSNATFLTLDFDQYFRAYTPGVNEEITVDVFDGTSWQNVYLRNGNTNGSIGSWGAPNHQSIDISTHANSALQLRFTYDGAWDYWWAVDNVILNGDNITQVESNVNSGSGYMEAELGPFATVHFYDENTGSVMLSIENLSGHDYGCTKVEIDNDGVGAYVPMASESNDVTDKNFIVTPEFNNSSGSYTVTLFYTQAEIDGWVSTNSQGSGINDLFMLKGAGAVSTAGSLELLASSPVTFGADYSFEATFNTGFSGFGLGNEAIPLPVELINFTARPEDQSIQLDWSTASELNNKGFELQRSTNPADGFESITWVNGRGTSDIVNTYQFVDKNVRPGIWYYYRLKQFDFNGEFEYSEIATAQIEGLSMEVFPNPVQSELQVKLSTDSKFNGQLQTIDVLGTTVMQQSITAENGSFFTLQVSGLPSGVYFIRLVDEYAVQSTVRFVKRK